MVLPAKKAMQKRPGGDKGEPFHFCLCATSSIFPTWSRKLFRRPRSSINALDAAMRGTRQCFLAAQKNAKRPKPTPYEYLRRRYPSNGKELLRLPDGPSRYSSRQAALRAASVVRANRRILVFRRRGDPATPGGGGRAESSPKR